MQYQNGIEGHYNQIMHYENNDLRENHTSSTKMELRDIYYYIILQLHTMLPV